MICPSCCSENIVKNGFIHNGKQKYMCKKCGRQFIEHPENTVVSQEKKDIIDRLLNEKISMAGICRAVRVSKRWLQLYVNKKSENILREVTVKKKPKGRLTIECDELCSFVGKKENKQWIWLAKDRESGEIVGCYIGKRDRNGAEGLWNSLPAVYRQCAVCYTDFWAAYEGIFPSKRHRPSGKGTGETNHIERFNNTLRQRISRLVRKTLSFSKKIENHTGAIWNFIHYYNSLLAD